ncbi:hypothetical protein MNBD_GAMMA05-2588 [hydrothermal vent metagenome]|uniref:histidine kinase n=1 Tax=hydrothermal vent metagenome TaxID=652676 RepID=A0A3B0WE19_9ZZZZ
MNSHECNKHRIETLYENNRFGWIGVVFLFVVMLYVMNVTFSPSAFIYLALISIGAVLHISNFSAYRRAVTEVEYNPATWAKTMMLLSAYNGWVLGSLPLKYLNLSNYAHTYFITTILVMSMYGSSIVAGSCKRVHVAWTLTSLLPLSISLTLSNDSELVILGFMLLLTGLPTSFLLNYFYYNMNEKSYRLRMENLELIDQVSVEKEKAEIANREKSRFLAATSHDLRQPLHALDLFLGALSNTKFTVEQNQLLDKAQRSSQSLAELLNALMDMSRLDAGNIVINREQINLEILMDDIVSEFKPQLIKNGISLHTHFKHVSINSDHLLLSRMIRNLITNAIKHSAATKMLLAIRTIENKALIEIYDNGVGIPKTEQKNIYSEFYQLENSERDRNKGLGLGLAIVKRLSQLLQYEVALFSEQGKGCHFRVSVPLSLKEHSDTPLQLKNKPEDVSNIDVSGLFIILIEDENEVRNAMRALLKQWGCELLAGESLEMVEQELNALPYDAPDLLLVDYRLREKKTGLEAILVLRKRFDKNIPSIVVTGETSEDIVSQIKCADCEVLNKPVSVDVLKSYISDIKVNH